MLASQAPHEAIKFIENGWESAKIPIDELYLREYFKAVAAIGKLDNINIKSLLQMLNKYDASIEGIHTIHTIPH